MSTNNSDQKNKMTIFLDIRHLIGNDNPGSLSSLFPCFFLNEV